MSWVMTLSRQKFDIAHPDPDVVRLSDIATSLAQTPRWNGQTSYPLSVAQHSVNVSRMVPERLARHALLHDAHEAYTGDITRPIKSLPEIGMPLINIETGVQMAILARFGMDPCDPDDAAIINDADDQCLADEANWFYGPDACQQMGLRMQPHLRAFAQLDWTDARCEFLQRAKELGI